MPKFPKKKRKSAKTTRVAPVVTFDGIIDLYYKNEINFDNAWAGGVRAIIHKASEGRTFKDSAYADRRKGALQKGFLWGAFHLCSGDDAQSQFKNFYDALALQPGEEKQIVLALDWERAKDGTIMILEQVHQFIAAFQAQFQGRYPMLYGGHVLRETPEVVNGDPILGKCPLWYQRYRKTPVGLPTQTWPTYTLWQWDNEAKNNGAPTIQGLVGEDWNRFQGTENQLKTKWPFA